MHNHAHAATTLLGSLKPSIVQAVGGITELNGIPGSGDFETRKANLTTFFEATKEVGKGAMETFERRIYHDRRQIRMCLFAMPLILLVEMQVLPCLLLVRYQLFQAGIIHLARGNQSTQQGLFLCLVWSKSVLIRSHGSSITGSDYMVNKQELKPQSPNRMG